MDCASVRRNSLSSLRAAVSRVREERIRRMTASMFLRATSRPSSTCASARARSSSQRERATITSMRWSRKRSSICLSEKVRGTPPSSAREITPKVLCSAVHLKSAFATFRASAPRFSSITIRMPSRSDSSRRSEMSTILPRFARSAICSRIRALLVL